MSAATRKQSVPGRVESPAPSSSPARGHATRASISGANTPLARRQSLRAGTPVSARAALQRRDSPLSNTSDADSDARAETVALIDDLKSRLSAAEGQSEQFKRQNEVLQSKLDESHKEQAKLEEKVHEGEEQIEALQNEKRDAARQMREMEAIYEAERSSMTKEKEEMANREEEMQMVIQRLKDNLAQRVNTDDEPRQSRQLNSSPSVDSGNFAPPSSIQRSDSRNSSKILLQKDKLIESLRLELAEAQIKLVESENSEGGRTHEVERLLMEARMANARLMEDNESYQLLLQEKTLNGDFAKSDFGFMSANQDALNALEGRSSNGDADHIERPAPGSRGMSSLADELSEAQEDDSDDRVRRLEGELKAVKDQNKALTLYINKIIERLLQHQEFESILDQSQEFKPGLNTNKELPPPPTSKQQTPTGPSLLQRAKSIAIGQTPTPGSGTKPKPRPMSVMPQSVAASSAHTDPERAPSIPLPGLGRSTSVRRSRPMSEQFIGAASVVNQMYRGPEGNGTTSPSLVSPRSSTAGPFFPKRSSSGAAVATSGNFPGMKSETSSTISSGDSTNAADGTSASATSAPGGSPPRSRDHHEKMMTFGGNKPRPLRLVQENNESIQTTNKRASWFGWMNVKKEDSAPSDPIRE
ncbi:putative m serotype protein [Zalerion maritima]|uniref:M serotype protein n=1 Tax=Zalerion maritima TaxID=339359 RepID=A0AAD5WRQ1_9PEZI|nr:putative m serotype protein [Zalerion maritima]